MAGKHERTEKTPDIDNFSTLTASTGRVREKGVGRNTETESAGLDDNQEFHDTDSGTNLGNPANGRLNIKNKS